MKDKREKKTSLIKMENNKAKCDDKIELKSNVFFFYLSFSLSVLIQFEI